MLDADTNAKLTQVGAETPMGELLRRYWHPVAGSSELGSHGTKSVRLLGEDLVLYRDRSGRLGLIDAVCPHRRAGLVFGVPETEGLRCAYHGWRFSADGQCLEQPYETTEDPGSTFNRRIHIRAYPVEELGGLIFAYLGPEPRPLLPRWDLLVQDGVVRDIGVAVIPCNWLQIMENSLDPVHVEWLHTHFSHYVLERLGRPDLKRKDSRGKPHKKIGFDRFAYGIIKRRVVEGTTEQDPLWSVGHPVLFPNILKSGGGRTFQYRVPVDDTHTLYWYYNTYPEALKPERGPQSAEEIPVFPVPIPGLDSAGQPQWDLLDNNSGQDITMWYTQGPVADRTGEHLGLSDRGIILYRRMLEENLEQVARGGDPLNIFRDPARNRCIEIYAQDVSASENGTGRTGNARKYSPILDTVAGSRQDPVH